MKTRLTLTHVIPRNALVAAVLAIIFALGDSSFVGGARSAPAASMPAGNCQPRAVYRLSFGLSGPQGDIGDSAWQSFLAQQIAPRFPAGHTVFEAQGQWLGANGQVVQERSRVVEVVHDGSAQQQQRVNEIVAHYKRHYQQEAVLVTRSNVLACL